ncbi:hypothetical protein JHK82_025263 [Glycine max]|uniref:MULE transposase domain-containing protein n=2 Tax=Glycine subgen. Soja TaxID=1462606 RepID=A0A0R0IFX4_SOYBN|nr:hypothetical protein JHK85_025887 [Glycine max]RZB92204.1 Protein FAR1-RELATED SEQUENCE 8 [Glycine soja]KAG5013124.1 hypothetical protein JHK86_025385 [Glycine max]KAG5134075.1 hypothetical protein JHK82_025263 [Glycine max]KAH1043163.1 hypothetical protein GYH30_025149 [Glycine max]
MVRSLVGDLLRASPDAAVKLCLGDLLVMGSNPETASLHMQGPTKSQLFRGNKNIKMHAQRKFQINDEVDVRLNKNFRFLACNAIDYDNLSFVERDVRNFVTRQRCSLGKEGDKKATLTYFACKKACSNDFFYDIDMDDDFCVKNVFWTDARSMAACEYFGDIVSFDTTYLTNKHDMPFALFVGINHHGRFILLGCGLLFAKDRFFHMVVPVMIVVTNQCRAMKNVIEVVFCTS